MYKSVANITISLILCGCFPAKYYITPSVSGTVTDIKTKKPIPEAIIHFKNYPDKKVYSDINGEFDLSEITEWEYVIILGAHDRAVQPKNLKIVADGYEPEEIEIGHESTYTIRSELKKKD